MIAAGVVAPRAYATPPSYEVHTYGIDDAAHDDPFAPGANYFDDTNRMNEAGHVLGYAKRFNGGTTELGPTRWLYDPDTETLHTINFIDAEHTRADTVRSSTTRYLNEAGQVIGTSNRYDLSSDRGRSAWFFDLDSGTTHNIGLLDTEHTKLDGTRDSSYDSTPGFFFPSLNEAGQAIGFSKRYNFGTTDLGFSAWQYEHELGVTRKIGFFDAAHTRTSDGYRDSKPLETNQSGHVAGFSKHYAHDATFPASSCNAAAACQSIWLHDPNPPVPITHNIGLLTPEHLHPSGTRFSAFGDMNGAGQVIGESTRYSGTSAAGKSAWFYDVATNTTTNIGLLDVEHTLNGVVRNSFAIFGGLSGPRLSEAGHVVGIATRYNNSTSNGTSAWSYNKATGQTTKIGLVNSEHTSNTDRKVTSPHRHNQSGHVFGHSERFLGGATLMGYSTWVYDPVSVTTRHVGLVDAEHTRNDGYKQSSSLRLNNAGHALGYSYRYNGSATQLGQSVWVYNPATDLTHKMGLVDPLDTEHLRNDGHRFSDVNTVLTEPVLNESGHVLGFTRRYNNGSTDLGESAWLFDLATATTRRIGLVDAMHTSSTGFRGTTVGSTSSSVVDGPDSINAAGQVIGVSTRYNGGSTAIGGSGWFYDPALNQTLPLVFSEHPTTRAAGTFPYYLGEDGTVLGSYSKYGITGQFLGNRLFYWSMADGFYDINDLIPGGISSDGWFNLNNMSTKTRSGWIAGFGTRAASPFPHLPYLIRPGAGLPGDYNNNGKVDAADYVLWRNDPNSYGGPSGYATWRANFGQPGSASGAGELGGSAVPEPGTIALIICGVLALATGYRRNASTR